MRRAARCVAALAAGSFVVAACSIDRVETNPLEGHRAAPSFDDPTPLRTGGFDGPTLSDHWHIAYGFYFCDAYLPPVTVEADPSGIHSHGEGVIHAHPFSQSVTNERAILDVFFDAAGIRVSDGGLGLPGSPTTVLPSTGECDGVAAELRLIDFGSIDEPSEPVVLEGSARQIAASFVGEDRTAIAFAFASDPADVPAPPSVANLDLLSPGPALPGPEPSPIEDLLVGDAVEAASGFGFQAVLGQAFSDGTDCPEPSAEADGECLALGEQVGGVVAESAVAAPAPPGADGFVVQIVLTVDSIDPFNRAASECFSRLDSCPTGRLAMVLDGQVLLAPVVQTPAFERDGFQIGGNFGQAEAERLAARISG